MSISKIKYLFVRLLPVILVLVLMVVSGILSWSFSSFAMQGRELIKIVPWTILGDAFIPLLLVTIAILFRNRYFMISGIISFFANIFLRTASIIIYRKSFMPLSWDTAAMLYEHTSHQALQAVLGPRYLLWVTPLMLLLVSGIGYCCFLVWKICSERYKRLNPCWLYLFSLLLILSGITNLGYFLTARFAGEDLYYTGHLVQPVPMLLADAVKEISAEPNRNQKAEVNEKSDDIPPEYRSILDRYRLLPLQTAADLETPPPPAVFDKIIIIALESLNLEYLAAVNPEMPDDVTPELDYLQRHYPAMRNYFAASQPTSWGLTALLMSRFDYHAELNGRRNISLFSLAKPLGYRTCYMSPITGVFSDNRNTYQSLFRPHELIFLEEWNQDFGFTAEHVWGLTDRTLYNGALAWLQQQKSPKMLVVISTIDTHPPYASAGLNAENAEKWHNSPFLRALNKTDTALKDFLDRLTSDRELYNDRTLIIITADHTATFGENYLKRQNFDPGRIPLIFVTPNRDVFAKLDCSQYASSIDLAPTIAKLIGAPVPKSFIGRDLFTPRNIALSFTVGKHFLIRTANGELNINLIDHQKDPEMEAFRRLFRIYYPE